MILQEFILLAGGGVDNLSLPRNIHRKDFKLLTFWLELLQGVIDAYSKVKGLKVTLHFILSPSLVCRTRPLEDGSVAILVPLGLPVRIRILARILLGYFGQESITRFANSLLDDIPESDWRIAPSLIPVFGEFVDESAHWRQLGILDSQLELNPEIEPAVYDLLWVALCYLTCHEFAHAIRGHFSVVEQIRSNSQTIQKLGGENNLRKALEIDADAVATSLMLLITREKMEAEGVAGDASSAFFWIGYAFTLIFGLYDSRRKALNLYSKAFYPHPIVRHALILDFAELAFAQNDPAMEKSWTETSIKGWHECVSALRHLDVDVFMGKFGTARNNEELAKFVPVTAMNYTIFDTSYVKDQVRNARALTESVLNQVGLGS